jgi:hypothetical protein
MSTNKQIIRECIKETIKIFGYIYKGHNSIFVTLQGLETHKVTVGLLQHRWLLKPQFD